MNKEVPTLCKFEQTVERNSLPVYRKVKKRQIRKSLLSRRRQRRRILQNFPVVYPYPSGNGSAHRNSMYPYRMPSGKRIMKCTGSRRRIIGTVCKTTLVFRSPKSVKQAVIMAFICDFSVYTKDDPCYHLTCAMSASLFR